MNKLIAAAFLLITAQEEVSDDLDGYLPYESRLSMSYLTDRRPRPW
jgi:hypothetical protein